MIYEFPFISHINDVLPSIKGLEEFVVVEKDDYTVINYVLAKPDTFPPVTDRDAAVRRECRGLVFAPDGNLIARRYHKFFNVGEKEELRPEFIDLSQPHVVLEKLDGSMVSPVYVAGGVMRWMTKMGITDVAMDAEVFVAKNEKYYHFSKHYMGMGYTPIFEWCSPKNRIVLNYPKEHLILTGIRDNLEGWYVDYETMLESAKKYDIPVVPSYGCISDIRDYLNRIAREEDMEGVVVRFDAGHMVKIKTEWYVQIHRAKEALLHEKDVVAMILSNTIDDVKPFLPESDRHKLEAFEHDFIEGIDHKAKYLVNLIDGYRDACDGDRKKFALDFAHSLKKPDCSLIFWAWDRPVDVQMMRDEIIKRIVDHSKTTKSLDKVRSLWYGENVRWSF